MMQSKTALRKEFDPSLGRTLAVWTDVNTLDRKTDYDTFSMPELPFVVESYN